VEYKTKAIPVITGQLEPYEKMVKKITELHIGKARNKGTVGNSHVGHCT